jgi:predicted ATPase/DNA-binding SARP family transcriptional activator
MKFRILGPLEVDDADGRAVALTGAKPRAVLAVLVLHANQPVSAQRLALSLWGEDAPTGAVKAVQVNVSRLRKALSDSDVLVTTRAGYRLRVRPGELDAERFESRVAAGRQALAAGRAEPAAELLREALALWRGAPLEELASLPFAPAEIARLEELHVAAVELRVEADLAAGRHAELAAELQQLTTRHPWRERLHAQLMLAHYRSGRQADALEAYRHAREILTEQLGIEPGPELHDLHQAMLVHDPALQAPGVTDTPASDRSTALPVPPNRTIGREREIGAVVERLRAGSVRLLALTGPGGVGKTRLALEAARAVAADFTDGAHFVSLAAIERPDDVPVALVAALGVTPLEGESRAAALKRFLAAKHLLLVVDNFEHVLAAAPLISALLAASPTLTILATSREPLNLSAEQRFPVPPLALPRPGTPLAGVDAVELFSERARAHDPDFSLTAPNTAAVAKICRRLDGLPLAIELAAARCDLLSPREIAERLDASFAALATGPRDAPARHQSLRATLDWSHELLSDGERTCFARFAVFAGGATIAAAETITGAELETLDGLVAKSLLVRHPQAHTPSRLGMLATVRSYADERFTAVTDHAAVQRDHYRHFLAVAERHGTDRALFGIDCSQHLAVLDAEIDNLHAALRWAVAQRNGHDALAMAAALGRYWRTRNRDADAVEWSDQALHLAGDDVDPAIRVRVLCTKARCLRWLGRTAEQSTVMVEAESVARRLGDPTILSQALQARADQEAMAGRTHSCEAFADEALQWARTADDTWEIANASYDKAIVASTIPELRTRVDWAAALMDEAGNVSRLARLLSSAAYSALRLGDAHVARRFIERATPITRKLDDPFQCMMLQLNLGFAALLTGDTDAAENALREELSLGREMALLYVADGLIGLAAVAAIRDDMHRAARLTGAAAAHRYGEPQDPVEARLHTTLFEPARTRCGTHAWDAAVRDGATLSLKDAIAYALEEPPAHTPNRASDRPVPVYPSH